MLKTKRTRKIAEEEMDITPMIDCTFLLLIFFLVASRMDAAPSRALPAARHGGVVVKKQAIILTMLKKGAGEIRIYKGESEAPENLISGSNAAEQEDAVTAYIESQLAATPTKKDVLIVAESGIKQREVARVEKAASRADIERLHVAVLQRN
jgi:biopolymer transport protein ExbD